MTSYLLSIDPSIKNTGFTLWEKQYCDYSCRCDKRDNDTQFHKWEPIWIGSYNFKKYGKQEFEVIITDKIYNFHKDSNYITNDKLNLIIERGTFHSKNGIGYETQEHLHGFIAGQFNKLITKDMLISPKEWQNWCLNIFKNNNYYELKWVSNKWEKEYSLLLASKLIDINNWNITISNHDEADSLLIGWYYLNKEVK